MASNKYTYLGPYDEFYPEGRDGPCLKPGDSYTMSEERKAQLGPRHSWAGKGGEAEPADVLAGSAFDQVEGGELHRETGSTLAPEDVKPEKK